ncbi:MAG: helix-turn-helix transcriptional regulator [Acidimicrobiales bacterium]|nr:helix-turn-helix transcriptional regulator [Acidimicrobiales bacterium]
MAEPCCVPITTSQLSESEADTLASLLKALADPVRLRIVSIIANCGEACACDLPAVLGRSQPTVSHHLSLLVSAGILDREQRGKWAWFKLNRDRIGSITAALA